MCYCVHCTHWYIDYIGTYRLQNTKAHRLDRYHYVYISVYNLTLK